MQIKPEFKPPLPPHLGMSELSEEEQSVAQSLSLNLYALHNEVRSFVSAVALFQNCRAGEHNELFSGWAFIAARDGAMTIRNFGTALAKIRSLIGRIENWLPLVDTKLLKDAETRFNKAFPFAHKFRHSVAHPELFADTTKEMSIKGPMEKHGIKMEDGASMTIQNMLSNTTFCSTFEGVFVEYDLTTETVQELIAILITSYDSFAKPTDFGHRFFPPRQ